MKEEALKLADELNRKEYLTWDGLNKNCEDMIRKLVAELDKQETFKPNQTLACPSYLSGLTPQTKPLAYEEKLKWRDERIAELEAELDKKDRLLEASTEALGLAMERAKNPYLDPEGNAQDFKKIADKLNLVKTYEIEKTGTWGTPQTKKCKDCGEVNPAEIHTCSPQTKPLSDEEILGAVARGWCSEKNSMKIMDSDLAMAIAYEVKKAIEERHGIK